MAQTTPNLGLTVWNLKSDLYDSGQLARNFIAIDQHDHSGNGKGSPIDATNAILNGSITGAKLATPAVGTGNLADGSVTNTKLADNSVTNTAIATDAVQNAEIQNDAVTNNKILSGTILTDKMAPIPACEISRITTQAWTSTSDSSPNWTSLDFTSIVYDTYTESGLSTAMADTTNNKIVAQKSGFYFVNLNVQWAGGVTAHARGLEIVSYISSTSYVVAEGFLNPQDFGKSIITRIINGIQISQIFSFFI
jgi:hypothetical protein